MLNRNRSHRRSWRNTGTSSRICCCISTASAVEKSLCSFGRRGECGNRFLVDYQRLCEWPQLQAAGIQSAGHLFACLSQVSRAFIHIFDNILGDSSPSVRLRRQVWESIFTNDLRRYRRTLFDRMGTLPTLVTGPSGTGKELVARAIGLSQYISFDEKHQRFDASADRFYALNLSALSPSLIESELFGHRKGAFTGAIADRIGWLGLCDAQGAVFLDEIGELDLTLQVKLLRVVQNRRFSRLGDSSECTFAGKLIGATNRDLGEAMRQGTFREDLYYRLCADRIVTPGLREQLDERPEDLSAFALYIARRLAGEDAPLLAEQSVEWILSNLGADYPWRGNIRELEQCISSILIRGEYVPSYLGSHGDLTAETTGATSANAGNSITNARSKVSGQSWLQEIATGRLNIEQVLETLLHLDILSPGQLRSGGTSSRA